MDEGYVKFECQWEPGPAPDLALLAGLDVWRQRMVELGLVGMYENGIGFGNLSRRVPGGDTFVITATATGALPVLGPEHFTVVTHADARANRVTCRGPARASSESMTHAVLYRLVPSIEAVIHAHGPSLWRRAIGTYPATSAAVPYGTPQMVHAVERLFVETDVAERRFFVMEGHEEGVVAFGASLDEAGERLAAVARELGVILPEIR